MRYVLAVVTRSAWPDELADPGPRHPAQVQQRDSPVAQVVPLGVRIVTQPCPCAFDRHPARAPVMA